MTDNDLCDDIMEMINQARAAEGMTLEEVRSALEMVRDILADEED